MAGEAFDAIGYPPTKLATVLNRSDSTGGISKADVEASLGSAIDYEIVSDGRLVVAANNEGVPFVSGSPDAPISQGVRRLADSLSSHLRERAPGSRAALTRRGAPVTAGGDPRPIGVFDSGVGGLTVLSEIRRRLPAEATVYLGDNARTPYGPRPADEVRALHARVRRAGCSTRMSRRWSWPATRPPRARCPKSEPASPVPVLGVVRPGAVTAAASTRDRARRGDRHRRHGRVRRLSRRHQRGGSGSGRPAAGLSGSGAPRRSRQAGGTGAGASGGRLPAAR